MALGLAGRFGAALIVPRAAGLDAARITGEVLSSSGGATAVQIRDKVRGGRQLAALTVSCGAGLVVVGLPEGRWTKRRAGARTRSGVEPARPCWPFHSTRSGTARPDLVWNVSARRGSPDSLRGAAHPDG